MKPARFIFVAVVGMLTFTATAAYGQSVEQRRQELVTKLNADLAAEMKSVEGLFEDAASGKITTDEYERRMKQSQDRMAAIKAAHDREIAALTAPVAATFDADALDDLLERRKLAERDRNEGRTNAEESKRRLDALDAEYERMMAGVRAAGMTLNSTGAAAAKENEVWQRVNQRWPGGVAGWPPTDGEQGTRTFCGLGAFTQSAGTRASYSVGRIGMNGPIASLTIYQTGGDTAAVFADLRRQIEAQTGRTMQSMGGYYSVRITHGGEEFDLNLSQRPGRVLFAINGLQYY
jgi:Tfp pilus assembly protein PilE